MTDQEWLKYYERECKKCRDSMFGKLIGRFRLDCTGCSIKESKEKLNKSEVKG